MNANDIRTEVEEINKPFFECWTLGLIFVAFALIGLIYKKWVK
jgi:hypothetical protein